MAAEGSSSEHHSVLYGPVNRLWESTGLAETTHIPVVPDHVVMALLVLVLVAVVFIPLRAKLKSEAALERPGKGQQLLELVVLALKNLMEDVIGHGAAKRFMPMIGALAFFIFLCNILGLFFFLQPPTGNTSPLTGILRIIPIERMNALLVISPNPAYIEEARKWIERLDSGGGEGVRFYVYHLQNTLAERIAPLLQQAFTGRVTQQASAPRGNFSAMRFCESFAGSG